MARASCIRGGYKNTYLAIQEFATVWNNSSNTYHEHTWISVFLSSLRLFAICCEETKLKYGANILGYILCDKWNRIL